MKTENKITESDLVGFIGTSQYYRHNSIGFRFNYTDGVKYLAENANCYWLLDIVASIQKLPKVKKHRLEDDFQSVKLTVNLDNSARFVLDDGNGNVLYTQNIPYTDFPLEKITLYFINEVLMLTSEY